MEDSGLGGVGPASEMRVPVWRVSGPGGIGSASEMRVPVGGRVCRSRVLVWYVVALSDIGCLVVISLFPRMYKQKCCQIFSARI